LTPESDVVAAGVFTSGSPIPGAPLASHGGLDAFVARLDGQTLAPVWARAIGGGGDDHVGSVATGPETELVYVGGTFTDAIDIDGIALHGTGTNPHVFVAALPR